MTASNKDSTSIDFDNDWHCYCQVSNDQQDEQAIICAINNGNTDSHWSSVRLPHTDYHSKRSTLDEDSPCQWWYYKTFAWASADPRLAQQVHLMFETAEGLQTSVDPSSIVTSVWLNQTRIFSGSLMPRRDLIALPSNLLRTEESGVSKCNNVLTICCANRKLALHAYLVFHGNVICASGQVDLNEEINQVNQKSSKKENDILDYTVSVDHDDGRIDVVFHSKKKYKAPLPPNHSSSQNLQANLNEKQRNDSDELKTDLLVPRLAVVILIVGTRGDVQPFIALGQALRASGHRVRLATHETFRSFVRGNGLEFYPLAGDPADLISFMVKNAGIIPSVSSVVAGDVAKKRRSLASILASTWLACTANDDETDAPFRAEVIIANPPSFGHIHCAEKLQIPLHIMFTMPWSPTGAFPHPLANIDNSTGPKDTVNRYSYLVIDTLTWMGMRDIVNDFRSSLNLLSLNTSQAVCALVDEQVPHTYCWSPALVPKPSDWGSYIDVSGFFFLDLGTAYTNPPQDLLNFLGLNHDHRSGQTLPPPIYIGFGSIAGHDARRILAVVIEALSRTGYRAILAGLASDSDHLPPNIFKVGNVPHDWLFQHVSAVCHHGGAGTTAAGLRAGKPTIIVPFFGDQFFWGTVIEKSGAGPRPIPGKSLKVDELVNAFHFVHKSTTRAAAEQLALLISKENGCAAAVHAFHRNLPLARMHSDLEPTFPACFRLEKYKLQISRPVAQVLVSAGHIEESQLRPHAMREWKFMYDNHVHVITHGFFEHFRKAFTTMFIDTASDLKRSASTNNLSTKALESAGTIAKGFTLGIGHISVGYLSLYGEITDVLDRVTYLYDPYSAQKPPPRPFVNGLKSGSKAAGLAMWNGWKEGITGIVKHPQAGYKKHGAAGAVAGSFIATINLCVKPAVGTLASLTWLSRGAYASLRDVVRNYQNEGRNISSKLIDLNSSLSATDNTQTSAEEDTCISAAAKQAAKISGYHPKICQHIIDEFEKLQTEHKHEKQSSSTRKPNPVSFLSRTVKKRESASLDRRHPPQ